VGFECLFDNIFQFFLSRIREVSRYVDEPVGVPDNTKFRRIDILIAVVVGDYLAYVLDRFGRNIAFAQYLFRDGRAFYFLVFAGGRAVFYLGLMNPDVMKQGRGPYDQRIAAFDGLNAVGIVQNCQSVLDLLAVVAEDVLNFFYELVPNYTLSFRSGDPEALLGILAPFGAAQIYLGIGYHCTALTAFQLWLVLEELDGMAAAGAGNFEYIVGLPISLVLSGASYHGSLSALLTDSRLRIWD